MVGMRMAAIGLAIGLVGCGGPEATNPAENVTAAPADQAGMNAMDGGASRAVANLQTAEGASAGTATVTANGTGVMLTLSVEGLPAGQHGAHVHMTGQCDAPEFTSAGGHWNPTSAQHGLENPQGQHAGDMPNLTVGEDGRGSLDYTLEGATMAGLFDADGAAVVVHASADDQKTDPSGDSGSRIACGVFNPA